MIGKIKGNCGVETLSDPNNQDPYDLIKSFYTSYVTDKHPNEIGSWPVLSGSDVKAGYFDNWLILFFKHTGNPIIRSSSNLGILPASAIGVAQIDSSNKEQVRDRIYKHFRAGSEDAVIFVSPSGEVLNSEFLIMLARHEAAMGLSPMKIFLSHKSPDKTLVRDFKNTLEIFGFSPWLDEEAMPAGMELERSILKGMQDSCAAVFFITPRFSDENYLASEINYAIQEYRRKPGKFSIITLVFSENNVRPPIPGLLSPFVWKEPTSHLEGLREIIRALPIKVGDVRWR